MSHEVVASVEYNAPKLKKPLTAGAEIYLFIHQTDYNKNKEQTFM